ncbi:protein phosphatase 2C domain-containing protein [Yinghuangia aomiensis]|uniref:Protein phosphatase 2C domain-containing protein n=1 Tax=Yinghuangia aomiensis TaxID=676205 RepID=A0ABP9I0U4_9ACTN
MEVTYATAPAPGRGNEDFVVAGERFVVVLDGATPVGESGCGHGVPWLVARLGMQLAVGIVSGVGEPLAAILAEAIEQVCGMHADSCDLGHPDSPSSTVTMLRWEGGTVDYLVLCDSPLVIEGGDGSLRTYVDDATAHLVSRTRDDVRKLRNRPGGFWVASTDPAAAEHALTGSVDAAEVRRVALMTDGLSRLVERYGWTWSRVLDVVETEGPGAAVRAVREAEVATVPGTFPGKPHDDATIALCRAFTP